MIDKVIQDVCTWNYARNNTSYDKKLEATMLYEEMEEYIEARTSIDEADALADIIFVAIGSLYKLTGSPSKVKSILNVVINANNKKGHNKTEDGKIKKAATFIGPEKYIEEILDGQ